MIDDPSLHRPRLHLVSVGDRAGGRAEDRVPGGLIVELRQGPLETFLDWLGSLGPHMRDELAFLLVALAPRVLLGGASVEETCRSLPLRVTACVHSAREEAGTILMLAHLVDFIFRGRCCAHQWAAIRDFEEEVAASIGDERLATSAALEAQRIPLRAKQWIRAFASWDALRKGQLSVEAIEAHLDEAHPLQLGG